MMVFEDYEVWGEKSGKAHLCDVGTLDIYHDGIRTPVPTLLIVFEGNH